MGKIMKRMGRTLECILGAYAAIFLGMNAYIALDSTFSTPKEHPSLMQIHKYDVDIDGQKKKLTLVGENHYYNRNEYEIGKDLVKKHKFIANECNEKSIDSLSEEDFRYFVVANFIENPDNEYYHKGSGRCYPNIAKIALLNGKSVFALEKESPIKNLNQDQRFNLLLLSLLNWPLSPLEYYKGKNEKPFDYKEVEKFPYKKEYADLRDEEMAQSIKKILERKEVDSLLATTGLAHTQGIIRNLKSSVCLEETID